MTTSFITQVNYLPTGCDRDDINAMHSTVRVIYRGTYQNKRTKKGPLVTWYSVDHMGSSLSRAGNWEFYVEKFQYQQYRFTFEEACEWAEKVVDSVKTNGCTWAERQEYFKETG